MSFGYKVFALQAGGWCASASDAEDTYNKYGRSYGCGANGEGGGWANQVYKIMVIYIGESKSKSWGNTEFRTKFKT